MQTKAGAWADGEDGLRKVVGHPALLPQKVSELPSPRDFLTSWINVDYFAPPIDDVPFMSTIGFFEKWQHWALHKGFLQHPESQTLLGGRNGTLYAVLSVVKILFSIGAVLGKLELPSLQPEGSKANRITDGDWERALGWCENWTIAIDKTTAILSKTFVERTQLDGRATSTRPRSPSWTSSAWNDATEHPAVPGSSAQVDPPPPPRPRPRPRPVYKQDVVPIGDENPDDLEDLRSLTDSERNESDTYMPKGGETEEDDDSEIEDPGAPDVEDRSLSAIQKGKRPAHGRIQAKPQAKLSGLEALLDTRHRPEAETSTCILYQWIIDSI